MNGFVRCDRCLDPTDLQKSIYCPKCENSIYCSRKCMLDDWKAKHKDACKRDVENAWEMKVAKHHKHCDVSSSLPVPKDFSHKDHRLLLQYDGNGPIMSVVNKHSDEKISHVISRYPPISKSKEMGMNIIADVKCVACPNIVQFGQRWAIGFVGIFEDVDILLLCCSKKCMKNRIKNESLINSLYEMYKCDNCDLETRCGKYVCLGCYGITYCTEKCRNMDLEHCVECTGIRPEIMKRCDGCLKFVSTILWCSICRNEKYCSQDCQKTAWEKHKLVCIAKKNDVIVEPNIHDEID